MLTITIAGTAASGKTTLAALFAEILQEYGIQVDVRDDSYRQPPGSKNDRLGAIAVKSNLDGNAVIIVTQQVNREPRASDDKSVTITKRKPK